MNLNILGIFEQVPRGVLLTGAALSMLASVTLIALLVYHNPPPLLRSLWSEYIAFLDVQLRALFLNVDPVRIAIGQIAAIALLFAVGQLGFKYWYFPALLVPLAPKVWLSRARNKRIDALSQQVVPFATALANAMRTTPNVGNALGIVEPLLTPPMSQEVGLVRKEIRLGSTLDAAFLAMATRVRCAELEAVLGAVLIGREVGGNVAAVLDETANTLREMTRLDGVLRSKTASGRVQVSVLALAPLVVILGFQALRPDYFAPMTDSQVGYTLCLMVMALWGMGVFLGRKVMQVEV